MSIEGLRDLFTLSPHKRLHEHKRTRFTAVAATATAVLLGGGSMVYARDRGSVPTGSAVPPLVETKASTENDSSSAGDLSVIDDPGDALDSAEDLEATPDTPTEHDPIVVLLSDERPAKYSVVDISTGHFLNVRSGPGKHSPVIALLPADANHIASTGRIASVNGSEWLQIEVDGVGPGWVFAAHLGPARADAPVRGDESTGFRATSDPSVGGPGRRVGEPNPNHPSRVPVVLDYVMLPSEAPGMVAISAETESRVKMLGEPGDDSSAVGSISTLTVNVMTTGRLAAVGEVRWIELRVGQLTGWIRSSDAQGRVMDLAEVIDIGSGSVLVSPAAVTIDPDGRVVIGVRDYELIVAVDAEATTSFGQPLDLNEWAESMTVHAGLLPSVEVVILGGEVASIVVY